MPKPRNYAIYVKDMRTAVADIVSYVDGYDYDRFLADKKTVDAVLRNFEILGEAAGRVPPEMRALAPDIEWQLVKDFRNVIAHFYRGIDLELVWDVIQNRLPALAQSLDRLTEKLAN
jgi:uncharacterized protein with HEPN domain